jgi:hypothetical protein
LETTNGFRQRRNLSDALRLIGSGFCKGTADRSPKRTGDQPALNPNYGDDQSPCTNKDSSIDESRLVVKETHDSKPA